MNDGDQPVAAQYCATFLKPEMWHIYRQITALRAYRPVVLARKREGEEEFPFREVVLLRGTAWRRELGRFWYKTLQGRPILAAGTEARRLALELERVRAAVLHIYFGHVAVHLLRYLERKNVPVVVSFHGADAGVAVEKEKHLAPLRRVFDLADLVLARSQALADDLADLGCAREKLRVHRTGIPLEAFPFAQRQVPKDGAWRLVQACRLIPKKGVETTLRAFAHFAKHQPGARLTIAGEGPLHGRMLELARQLGVGERVDFTGFLPQEELLGLLYQAHLFMHPSQTGANGDREGVPNAMLEAMATGLPAIATRHGGIPEAVRNGVNGVLAAEGGSEELATGMIQLADEPERYAAMSAAAGRTVAEEWELHARTRLLEQYYDEARRTWEGSGGPREPRSGPVL